MTNMRKLINLMETVWADSSSAGRSAKQYQGQSDVFVHFTNIQKIGINPLKKDIFGEKSQTHNDAQGIYCYPVDFVLRHGAWDQFAMEFPFYYIVRVKDEGETIDLSNMSERQAQAIADRNGWGDTLRAALEDDRIRNMMLKKNQMSEDVWDYIGATFWGAADWLVNAKVDPYGDYGEYYQEGMTWSKLFKGISWMLDPGLGIINANEPEQILIFKTSAMEILEHGSNKDLHNDLAVSILGTVKSILGTEIVSDGNRKIVQSDLAKVTVIFGKYGVIVEIESDYANDHRPLVYRLNQTSKEPYKDTLGKIVNALKGFEQKKKDDVSNKVRTLYGKIIVDVAKKLGLEATGKWGDAIKWDNSSYNGLQIDCQLNDDTMLNYTFYSRGEITIQKGYKTIKKLTLPDDPLAKFSEAQLAEELTRLFTNFMN